MKSLVFVYLKYFRLRKYLEKGVFLDVCTELIEDAGFAFVEV
jgi:hypothetical protein